MERETAARRAQIELQLEDEARKRQALEALEEEHQARVQEIRSAALSGGADFVADNAGLESDPFEAEMEAIRARADARIEAIREAYAGEIELHREAQEQIREINEAAAKRIETLHKERMQGYVSSTADAFGSVAKILKKAGKEQSAAYKIAIAAQRAFTAVSIGLSAAKNLASASEVGFPQNIPFIAGALAQIAQITALFTQAQGFAEGGQVGGRFIRVSNGEHRISADRAAEFLPLLRAINSGRAPSGLPLASGGASATGHIRGPGTSKSDSIFMRANAGDFIVQAPHAQRYRDLLSAIETGRIGRFPRFNVGGLVGGVAQRAVTQVPIEAARSANVQNNIYNNAPAEIRTELNPTGGVDVYIDAITSEIGRGGGPFTDMLEARYGLSRQGT